MGLMTLKVHVLDRWPILMRFYFLLFNHTMPTKILQRCQMYVHHFWDLKIHKNELILAVKRQMCLFVSKITLPVVLCSLLA